MVLQEEIRDLLSPDQAASAASPSVHIREVVGGGVCLAGAHEKDVTSKEQMAAILDQVPLSATARSSCSLSGPCSACMLKMQKESA
jgi:hypothetical protein